LDWKWLLEVLDLKKVQNCVWKSTLKPVLDWSGNVKSSNLNIA